MQALRGTVFRRWLLDLLAFTGAGWAGIRAAEGLRKLRTPKLPPFTVERVEDFSEWVDPLWQQAKNHYAMTAVRDFQTLRTLYPASDAHFTRLRVHRSGHDIGWAVVGERRKDGKYGSNARGFDRRLLGFAGRCVASGAGGFGGPH